jgi:hypothetical protein
MDAELPSATICLPIALLKGAPDQVRKWILESVGVDLPLGEPAESKVSAHGAKGPIGLARLSDEEAQRFMAGALHKRTRATIRAIAELQPRFRWADLMGKLGLPIDDKSLAGVWAALTKRTRSVTGDRQVQLLAWPNWDDSSWETAVGQIDPETHAAFGRVLEIS